MDVVVSAFALAVLVRAEGRRLHMRRRWLPIAAVLLVGVSLGLPLFLYMRESALERRPGAEESRRRPGLHRVRSLQGGLMVTVALLVRLEAKPGKEAEVESFLKGGLAIVNEEPATTAWFAIRLGPSSFGIFDAFPGEAGRQAHISGRVAAALMAKAADLLSKPPSIEKVDVLAAKLPG